jgi:hypothetical protein
MNNEQSAYLNARLGIVSNTNKVPYGWEIPEDETTPETRASTDTFSRLKLVSVLALTTVLGFGLIQITLNFT